MKTHENQDEVSVLELYGLIRRNLVFIVWSVVLSVFIALFISGGSYIFARSADEYSLTTNFSLTGDDIKEQTVTIILNSFSHSSVLKPIEKKLNINLSEYNVVSKRTDNIGIMQLVVEGPDASKLNNFSIEIFNQVKPLIETAIPNVELRMLDISSPIVISQSNQAIFNLMFSTFLGILIGGMLSVFYVFVVYFMSPNIIEDYELESLFETRILGKFLSNPKKQTLRKFFEVR